MVRCRFPTAVKELHGMMWIWLQAKCFRAIKKDKSARKAKRAEGKKKKQRGVVVGRKPA